MTPWVQRLVFANVVMYLITLAVPDVVRWLALVPILVPFRPWTPITYMFLHGGLGHIFFNMLGLFFFGPRLEQRLGGRRFLWLYFTSGLMGAALSLVTPMVPVIGASGAVFGVLLGFAHYWPREPIYIWGVFPVEARVLVVVVTALSLFAGFTGAQAGIAHFAHLGGFLGGFLYIRWMERRSPARLFRARAAAPARSARTADSDMKRWAEIRRDQMHPVNRAELDRVLDKINTSGVGSLTADERAFLDRFSSE